jgi:hypothetical protein
LAADIKPLSNIAGPIGNSDAAPKVYTPKLYDYLEIPAESVRGGSHGDTGLPIFTPGALINCAEQRRQRSTTPPPFIVHRV